MIGPFIDTIIVCTMTALAILITGVAEGKVAGTWIEGAVLTSRAFATVSGVLPYFLALAVFIFAFSTIISWCYYGERSMEYLFGRKGIFPYRIVYTLIVIVGPVLSLSSVVDFADMMLLSMAFPNIIAMIIMSRKMKSLVKDYIRRLQSGEMKPRTL